MKIAVDVAGTDYGPAEIIKGVLQAVEYGCDAVLVGDEDVIRLNFAGNTRKTIPVTIHHASEVIEMKDHPGISVKKKRDASIVVATDLLRIRCDTLVSSGIQGQLLLLPCSAWAVSRALNGRLLQRLFQVSQGQRSCWILVPRWTQNRNEACPKCHHGIGLC